jgi:ABC-type antimicrobial peptide transport system permease subunit
MALGATPIQVGRFVAGPLAATVGIGLVLGVALAFAASRWARSLFYGIGPFEVLSIGVALGLVAAVTWAASAPPCWRAIRVDPSQSLREE